MYVLCTLLYICLYYTVTMVTTTHVCIMYFIVHLFILHKTESNILKPQLFFFEAIHDFLLNVTEPWEQWSSFMYSPVCRILKVIGHKLEKRVILCWITTSCKSFTCFINCIISFKCRQLDEVDSESELYLL